MLFPLIYWTLNKIKGGSSDANHKTATHPSISTSVIRRYLLLISWQQKVYCDQTSYRCTLLCSRWRCGYPSHSVVQASLARVLGHNGEYIGLLQHLVPTIHSPKPPFLLHLLSGLEPIHEQSRVFPLFCTKYQSLQPSLSVGLRVGLDVGDVVGLVDP